MNREELYIVYINGNCSGQFGVAPYVDCPDAIRVDPIIVDS